MYRVGLVAATVDYTSSPVPNQSTDLAVLNYDRCIFLNENAERFRVSGNICLGAHCHHTRLVAVHMRHNEGILEQGKSQFAEPSASSPDDPD